MSEKITFKRTGETNSNGSIPGILSIGPKSWPTIERGNAYTFVRRGEYRLKMTYKTSGRRVKCLMFDHNHIRTHLIHDALNDDHKNLAGCIAPGLTCDQEGIAGSAEAMEEIWTSLGSFREGKTTSIDVENNLNNAWRNDTKEAWLQRRREQRR